MDFSKFVNKTGYLKGSETENNPFNIIPSGNITMNGVDRELLAIPFKNGIPQKTVNMKPNENFKFDADFVVELPKLQLGTNGAFLDPFNLNNNKPTGEDLINMGVTGTTRDKGLFAQNRIKKIGEIESAIEEEGNTSPSNFIGEPDPSTTTEMEYTGNSELFSPSFNFQANEGVNSDMEGNLVIPEGTSESEIQEATGNYNFKNYNSSNQYFNPYGGINLESALFTLGQSFGSKGSKGNTLRGVGAAGKSLLNIGRIVGAGVGYGNRDKFTRNYYEEEQRKALTSSNLKTAKEGGLFHYFKNGGSVTDLTTEKALTGEYITGLPEHAEKEANAEVEVKEYIKHPNGDVQQVVGKTHKQGGEKVNLEEGTLVVSDYLKIGGEYSKNINKEFDIKTNAKDSFASVISKYTKKIGLTELNNEQEKLFKKVKEQEAIDDDSTQSLNLQFLSGKIKEIEDKKKLLEADRAKFTDYIFDLQESTKGSKEEGLEYMQKGGTIKGANLKKLFKKYNLDEEQGSRVLKKYQEGVETKEEPPLAYSFYQNAFRDDSGLGLQDIQTETTTGEVSYEDANIANFGFDTSEEQGRLRQLRENFPVEFNKYFKETEDGIIKVSPSEEGLLTGRVSAFQRDIDKNYQYLIDEVAPTLPESQRESFIQEVKQRRFEESGKRARGFDDKVGLFTGSRTNAVVNFATPKDLKKLKELGITTRKQLYTPDGELKEEVTSLGLDKETLDSIERTKGQNANYLLGEINPNEAPAELKGEEEPSSTTIVQGEDKGDTVEVQKMRKRLGLPLLPDQSVLPPDGVQPHLKINRRLERLDPVKITNEENIKEINRSEAFVANQLSSLPDSQRRAALANLTANSQENINKSVTQVNIANAQNFQETEKFNINQSNLEENYRAVDALDFERRQLTALAKTEADLFNYFDYNRKIQLGNFNTINRMNTLNSLFENYNIGIDGGIELDRANGYRINVPDFNPTSQTNGNKQKN